MKKLFSRTRRPVLCRLGLHRWRQQYWYLWFCRRCPATKALDVVGRRYRVYDNHERIR